MGLHLPQAAWPRGGGRGDQMFPTQEIQCPQPARVEPLTGVCCEDCVTETSQFNSGNLIKFTIGPVKQTFSK